MKISKFWDEPPFIATYSNDDTAYNVMVNVSRQDDATATLEFYVVGKAEQ